MGELIFILMRYRIETAWPKELKMMPDEARVPVYPRKYVNVLVVGGDEGPYMQAWKMSYPVIISVDKWR